MSSIINLAPDIPRRDIYAFMQWLKGLPEEETSFLRQTFDTDEVRTEKLTAKWNQYQADKATLPC